jgi:hypothetical protein
MLPVPVKNVQRFMPKLQMQYLLLLPTCMQQTQVPAACKYCQPTKVTCMSAEPTPALWCSYSSRHHLCQLQPGIAVASCSCSSCSSQSTQLPESTAARCMACSQMIHSAAQTCHPVASNTTDCCTLMAKPTLTATPLSRSSAGRLTRAAYSTSCPAGRPSALPG